MSTVNSAAPALPVSGIPLDVSTWITQLVTTTSATEAVEIADAIKTHGFQTPKEVAGLLCDAALYTEIVDLTRKDLNLRHRSILSLLAKACKEVEAAPSSSDKKSSPAEPQLSASDIKKIFEDSGTTPPCLDLLAGPELFRKLTRDNTRTEATFPGRKPLTQVDLFKEAKPLSERDLARSTLNKEGDFWDTIQSILELKEDEKSAPKKRQFGGVVEWARYWFTYAYAALACGQLTMETATAHCNNVCTLATLHNAQLALRYDQLVRFRISQLVANGSHKSDKLADQDAAVVSELLNEQLAHFSRKQLGSDSSNDGTKRRKKDWHAKGKSDNANPSKGKGKGNGKKKKDSAPSPA